MIKAIVCATLLFLALPSLGRAQTPYYQGKTVTIIVGTGAGDLYDLYARSIALFMGKYLPGNPNIIVQNMPGAGHMIAAQLYLQLRQTGRSNHGGDQCGSLFRAVDRTRRGEIRLD